MKSLAKCCWDDDHARPDQSTALTENTYCTIVLDSLTAQVWVLFVRRFCLSYKKVESSNASTSKSNGSSTTPSVRFKDNPKYFVLGIKASPLLYEVHSRSSRNG